MRVKNGISKIDLIVVAGVLIAAYFGYQYFAVYREPSKLINKEFLCRRAGGVPAYQDPHMLAKYLRLSSASARFVSPDKAIENATQRNLVSSSGLVDLDGYTPNSSLVDKRCALGVRVLDTYTGEKDLLLLRVEVLNKLHRGETWYICADKIDPLMNVTGFADKATRLHKPGIDDLLESKQGQKLLPKSR